MIPAGFENRKFYNKYDNANFDIEDFDESDFDENDEFVFDFNQNKKADNLNEQSTNEESVQIDDTNLNSELNNFKQENNKQVTYEINNNYYCDESEYVLDDLKYAILNKNLDQVKDLIENNDLDVNCTLKSNWIPIMYAVSCGSFELTQYLIEKGADVNFSDDTYNVLMCACGSTDPSASEYNLLRIIELLISKGADVNSCDKYYQTPLMYVCRAGNTRLIECLIRNNADIDAKDDNDWTSLSHASSKGNFKCVHKLLQLGADPLICTVDYLYPFDLAKNSGYNNVKDLIKNFLRVKKLNSYKSNNCLEEFFENEDEDELDDGLSYTQINKTTTDDLETFLNALKLSNLIKLFKVKNITMQILVNYNEDDLKQIGILDDYIRQLILNEIRKFHHKNWLSTSLIPVKHETALNCIEAIAIISNISRHIDYMAQNVKYLKREGIDRNKDLFEDEYLNMKFYNETKQAYWNCNYLIDNLNNLYESIKKEAKHSITAVPIDLVKLPERKKWYKDPVKITAFSAIAVSSIFIIKTKFFS